MSIDMDALMRSTADEVRAAFTPDPRLTDLGNLILRMERTQAAQVKALQGAGVKPGDLAKPAKPAKPAKRSADEQEAWRAEREASARRHARQAQARLDRLRAQVREPMDRAAMGGDMHPSVLKRAEREIERHARLQVEIVKTERQVRGWNERVAHWQQWTPATKKGDVK